VIVTEFYSARTIKRKRKPRRTKAQVEQLEQQILEVLAMDHPQSVQHIYYRMTDPSWPEPVEKNKWGARQVQQRVLRMRRTGNLQYAWVVDAVRLGYHTETFYGAQDFVQRLSQQYRAPLWDDTECRCEVWVESRSIASVIRDVCREYAVSLFPCGGFTSPSFVYEAADEHNELYFAGDTRPLQVFFFGDFDKAGVLVDVKLKEELLEHLHPGIELRFERLGINQEQVEFYDLPRKPNNPNDRRSLDHPWAVEAEAMPAHLVRQIFRQRFEDLLPGNALAVAKVAEASERQHLIHMTEMLNGGTT
jgi:hypothetical protein